MGKGDLTNPKMSRSEAIRLWNSLTPLERQHFNNMLERMNKGELMLQNVNVDDNEVIQNIVLEPKDKPSQGSAKWKR